MDYLFNISLRGKPSTVEEIKKALRTTRGTRKGNNLCNELDYDEIYDDLYLSSWTLAKNIESLRQIGIAHVLNAAERTTYCCTTGPLFHIDSKITYLGFRAEDVRSYDLSQHFAESIEFINSAFKSGGKVLVHCHQGVSRSATVIAAYLIKERIMSAADAIKVIQSKREINPNFGFIQQLANHDKMLYERH